MKAARSFAVVACLLAPIPALADGPTSIPIQPPTPTSIGGVFSLSPVAHQFVTGIGTNGAASVAQPDFSDVSGTATVGQGGTGKTSFTAGLPLIGNGTGEISQGTVSGTSGTFLETNGSGASLTGITPQVATESALAAFSTTGLSAGQPIIRGGYYAPGDGGGATYVFATSSCSLNAGAGDGGYQVKPTSGSGGWVA